VNLVYTQGDPTPSVPSIPCHYFKADFNSALRQKCLLLLPNSDDDAGTDCSLAWAFPQWESLGQWWALSPGSI